MMDRMGEYMPPALKKEFSQKRKEIDVADGGALGAYKEYVQNSIASTCLFLYGENWLEKASGIEKNMDWERIKTDASTISGIREGMKGKRLSSGYITAVAALADIMEQETGVERKTLLALAMQETRGDHSWYNDKNRNVGIMQLTPSSPLFTYVSAETPTKEREIELKNVMRRVLPEKEDFGRAKAMMSALYYGVKFINMRQGDLAMNMLAGALTYAYKYCVNSGIAYSTETPIEIGMHRESVMDYNGSPIRKKYADSVQGYWSLFGTAFAQKTEKERLAVVPKKTG